ncbi:low affinity iron permease family protein [Streptomyces gardneri]|uniref:low affinity iron permease family protein n=1 Tax=Streptomyces gardneri TaxID=66892 RepID=UPI0006BDA7D8|nr:low affinity iron permease family protein [Streptomyces gardneri]QPK49446.1 low affinity iron permease family protein [Streptomyces gardneri]WRK40980.1 low affinity iron permease family protein [Streptomyces venezuelae]CUM36634.1 Phage protein [Streptomyces venezuelae]
MTLQHPSERGSKGRGPFERLAERASNLTSSPLFFSFCLLLVGAFIVVHAAGLPLSWQLLVGDTMVSVTLLLLALLKNAERRADRAVQRKLDAIALALLEEHRRTTGEVFDSLEEAIGLEEDS